MASVRLLAERPLAASARLQVPRPVSARRLATSVPLPAPQAVLLRAALHPVASVRLQVAPVGPLQAALVRLNPARSPRLPVPASHTVVQAARRQAEPGLVSVNPRVVTVRPAQRRVATGQLRRRLARRGRAVLSPAPHRLFALAARRGRSVKSETR